MRTPTKAEATVSLRWLVPFLRFTGADPDQTKLLQREGITLLDFVNPDTRLRHAVAMELLSREVERLNEPGLGLRVGTGLEAGDFDPLEYASRSCANLRESIHCANRYLYLMHGALEACLIEEDARAVWRMRVVDTVPQPPAVNEFALACACSYSHRYTGIRNVLREVRMRHREPTSPSEAYRQVFDQAELRFGMPDNELVFDRAHLDAPMLHAHRGLQKAYEHEVSNMLERFKRREGASVRVRQQLVDLLRTGNVSMPEIARRLGMSVPTLRRRLSEERTSLTELLEDVRRELAERYLVDPTLAMTDVAFLLGFAHVTAFYKAFRRWSHGATPAEFRAKLRGGT